MLGKNKKIRYIEKCYSLYEQKMYQVAYRILHDEGMAEDAVQEAFIKLMKSETIFDDVKSDDCKRFIITVIKNASITIYNKIQRESNVIYLSDHEDMQNLASEDYKDEEIEELRRLMEKLPTKYYLVLECLIIKELSVKETAKELSLTEANVRKRFERAKLLLKNLMKGSEEYEKYRYI